MKKIELLILFAFDMFINRWLSAPGQNQNLDRFFGTQSWRGELEQSRALFEDVAARRDRFLHFYMLRVKETLGYKFVDAHGPLTHGRRVLYHMIFATDHEVGQRIMKDVWKAERAIPGELFYNVSFELAPD